MKPAVQQGAEFRRVDVSNPTFVRHILSINAVALTVATALANGLSTRGLIPQEDTFSVDRQTFLLAQQVSPTQYGSVGVNNTAFHPASPEAEAIRVSNDLLRTNNPTVNKFSAEKAARQYERITGEGSGILRDVPEDEGGTGNFTQDALEFKERFLTSD